MPIAEKIRNHEVKNTASFVSYSQKRQANALIIYPPHKRVPHVHLNELGFDEFMQKYPENFELLDLVHYFFGSINCREDTRNELRHYIDWEFFIEEENKTRIIDHLSGKKPDKKISNMMKLFGRFIPKDYEYFILIVAFPKQTSVALCLAKYLKELNPDCKIVVTRSIHNSFLNIPARIKELIVYPFVDIVANGFEGNMVQLAQGSDLSEVQNIIYKKDGRVFKTRLRNGYVKLFDLPSPRYKHLENKDVKLIYYEVTRGCKNKCYYCSHADKLLNIRRQSKIISDLQYLINKFNCHDFQLLTTAINFSKPFIIDLCNQIIDNKLNIKWSSYIFVDLIDEETAAKMHEAGCVFVDLGIESPIVNTLNAMKINQMQNIERNLAILKKYDIKVSASFLTGSINYDDREEEELIKFLIKNKDLMRVVNLNMFEVHQLNLKNVEKHHDITISRKFLLDRRYYEFSDNKFKDYNDRKKEVARIEENIIRQVESQTDLKMLHWDYFPTTKYECGEVEAAYINLFTE